MKPELRAGAELLGGIAGKIPDVFDGRGGGRFHRHYGQWFTGDGAATEFRLDKTIGKDADVLVFVAGALKRPDENGTAHDYRIRGVTGGYAGDRNTIKFAAAPAAGAAIYVAVISA